MSFLRPNTALIERRVQASLSLTNEPIANITTIYAAVPSFIDALSVQSRTGGNLEAEIEGVVYLATDIMLVDGLTPSQFLGTAPGGTLVVGGLSYLVDGAGLGAYIDLRVNDRITDENGRKFLVLAVNRYPEVAPNLQARLAFGRSW